MKQRVYEFLKKIGDLINSIFYAVFLLFPIKNTNIVFESEGDLCDNAYALYDYMQKKQMNYKYIWLVDNLNHEKRTQTVFVKKWTSLIDIKRSYYLATSKYYIYDHNNMLKGKKSRKDRIIVNLWHGSPFKGSSASMDNNQWMDVVYSSGKVFNPLLAKFVGCDVNKVKDLGYPRTDYLFSEKTENIKKVEEYYNSDKYSKVFLWMPTFRKSKNVDISENYFESETGLPLITNTDELGKFNDFLKNKNSVCVFKIHHLQAECEAFKTSFSNILILKDEDLHKFNVQLYQFIAITDSLITDYSSISVDYLLLNRPIIYTLDDYDEYKRSRGFIMDNPIDYFPGYHVYSMEELFEAVNEVSDGKDCHSEDRKRLMPEMNTFSDGNSSARILKDLGI